MRAFRKYSNQDIYNLLTKKVHEKDLIKEAAMKKEAAIPLALLIPLLTGGAYGLNSWLGRKGVSGNVGHDYNSKAQTYDQGTPENIRNWFTNNWHAAKDFWGDDDRRLIWDNSAPQLILEEKGIKRGTPQYEKLSAGLEKLDSWYNDLYDRVMELNQNRGDANAYNAYYAHLDDLSALLASPELSDPILQGHAAKLLDIAQQQMKSNFTNINPMIYKNDVKGRDGNPLSLERLKRRTAIGLRQQALTKPTIDSVRAKIETDVATGKLTYEQGRAQLQEWQHQENVKNLKKILANAGSQYNAAADKYNETLDGPNSNVTFSNKLDQNLSRFFNSLDNLDQEDLGVSEEMRDAYYDMVAKYAPRFPGLKNTMNRIMDRRFGDISVNPLYKKDATARANLFKQFQKFNPSMTQKELYDKIWGNTSNQERYKDFYDVLKSNNHLSMGYDNDTNELVYGYGYDPKNFSRLAMSRSEYNKLNDPNAFNNIEATRDNLIAKGVDPDTARRIALARVRTIHMKEYSGQKRPHVRSSKLYESNAWRGLMNGTNNQQQQPAPNSPVQPNPNSSVQPNAIRPINPGPNA